MNTTSSYDSTCIKEYQYNASGTIATTTERCNNPLELHTGSFLSFMTTAFVGVIAVWFILGYKKHGSK